VTFVQFPVFCSSESGIYVHFTLTAGREKGCKGRRRRLVGRWRAKAGGGDSFWLSCKKCNDVLVVDVDVVAGPRRRAANSSPHLPALPLSLPPRGWLTWFNSPFCTKKGDSLRCCRTVKDEVVTLPHWLELRTTSRATTTAATSRARARARSEPPSASALTSR